MNHTFIFQRSNPKPQDHDVCHLLESRIQTNLDSSERISVKLAKLQKDLDNYKKERPAIGKAILHSTRTSLVSIVSTCSYADTLFRRAQYLKPLQEEKIIFNKVGDYTRDNIHALIGPDVSLLVRDIDTLEILTRFREQCATSQKAFDEKEKAGIKYLRGLVLSNCIPIPEQLFPVEQPNWDEISRFFFEILRIQYSDAFKADFAEALESVRSKIKAHFQGQEQISLLSSAARIENETLDGLRSDFTLNMDNFNMRDESMAYLKAIETKAYEKLHKVYTVTNTIDDLQINFHKFPKFYPREFSL